ncbi:hypothetical protein BRD09_01060 [Halobacteriales archaeon SW_10_68_16]|jgi:uncharacterized membrane protein|nr:MAG: hypothetical protein BRD09_01060 [Halobacteriales archaeon SW_10_68_16]
MVEDFAPTRTVGDRLRGYFLRGVLFVVPALVTLAIVVFAVGFVSGFLQPVASFVTSAVGVGGFAADLVILLLSLVAAVVIGAAIETLPHGVEAADFFHSAVESIPGVGRVYAGFREMSTTIARGEESFRDVKLVEYPSEGSYTMAFVTADAPPSLEESVGHTEEGMMSLFMPMGPNPVMGGFVVYVARDRVYDIDLSVEEGLQAIITSGVTVGNPEGSEADDRLGVLEDAGD